jgi:hypothetical protein
MPGELYAAALVAIAAVRTVNPDWGSWLGDTISAQSILQLLGGGILILLFATNRILTRGQHLDRIADLQKHHAAEMVAAEERRKGDVAAAEAKYTLMLSEKDARYSEQKEQLVYWQNTAERHDVRANKATEQLVEMNELAKLSVHAFASFEEAAKLERGESA